MVKKIMSNKYKNTDSNYLYKQFKDIAEDMMADFTRLKRDKGTNKTDEGEYLERILLKFLELYLPRKVAVGRGYIMNSSGLRSLQQDIVIYDPYNYVLLKDTEGFQVFPVECVHATIEVKSTLTKEILRLANRNIVSIKGLSHNKYWYRPDTGEYTETTLHGSTIFSSIFSFQADSSIENCAANLKEINESIDCIHILNRGVIFYGEKQEFSGENKVGVSHKTKPDIKTDEIAWINPIENNVSAFPLYSLLSGVLNHIDEFGDEKGSFSLSQYVNVGSDKFLVSLLSENDS